MIERLLVRGSLVANSMTSIDSMDSRSLEIRLKICVLCHDMDGRLKNPRAIKIACGFKTISNASSHIGLGIGPHQPMQC